MGKIVMLIGLLVVVVVGYLVMRATGASNAASIEQLVDYFASTDEREMHVMSAHAICCVCRDIRKKDGWCETFWTLTDRCLKAPTQKSWIACTARSFQEDLCTTAEACQ